MPTPSSNSSFTPPALPPRTHSSSCPEDARPSNGWSPDEDGLEMNSGNEVPETVMSPEAMDTPTAEIAQLLADARSTTAESQSRSVTASPRPVSRSGTELTAPDPVNTDSPSHKPTDDLGEVQAGAIAATPTEQHRPPCDVDTTTTERDKLDSDDSEALIKHGGPQPSMGFDYSNFRVLPISPSSFLRPGSKFTGTQQSERQVYDVEVVIKYVDLRESFLCGYLKIQGLTEDNPDLTTYFEGEIIGNRYSFLTKHKTWGATEKIDLNHWGKFSAFRQYSKQVRKGVPVTIPNLAQRENIFMRWKERFLVPDHRVTSINGASFEGFYYICFNQKEGTVSGIYFHSKSEKFQQLELKHVQNKGCFSALEFR
ncbi:vacuolar import and degradation protein-domain-containing protein [Nemania sp. FL0916]|nr:vacuolar import and degradation protein-domain-containing protein [Nemania sp. FL0916]